MRHRYIVVLFCALSAACSGDVLGPVAEPPAIAPSAGFASNSVFVVSSERTTQSLAVLSMNALTGEVGLLPASPAQVGITVGDAETLAADPARRRVFFGSNETGDIAVLDIDPTGRAVPVGGSPFLAERTGVSVIKVSPSGDSIYVGYHDENILSRYAVSPSGVLTLAQTISTVPNVHVETMLLVGDVLYVGFLGPAIVGFRIDAAGAFAMGGGGGPVVAASITTNLRPDYLVVNGGTLYCSLANDASVDAMTIETDGSLTRLPGAPYAFPGMGLFELIKVQPGGGFIAVGGERPSASVGLYTVNGDGSLAPAGPPLVMHDRKGGPEGMAFSADGTFLYVCDHVGEGLYVFEVVGSTLTWAATPRYVLPGRQIDVLRLDLPVGP